jgi:hypothetical protein
LQIPFGLAAGFGLAAVLTLIFSVEVFMSEVYNGPFKQFLVSLRVDRLTLGFHAHGLVFDFDTDILGDIYEDLKVVDEF